MEVQGNYYGTQRPQGLKGQTRLLVDLLRGNTRSWEKQTTTVSQGGKPPCAAAKVSESVSAPRDLSMVQTHGKLIPRRIEIKIGEAGEAQW